MATEIYHEKIRNETCVMGPYIVEFDEYGHAVIEDDEYAMALVEDNLGYSLVIVEQRIPEKPIAEKSNSSLVEEVKKDQATEKPIGKSKVGV